MFASVELWFQAPMRAPLGALFELTLGGAAPGGDATTDVDAVRAVVEALAGVSTRRSSHKPGFWQRTPAERLGMLTLLCESAVDTYLVRCCP